MNRYEVMYIINAELDDEAIKALVEKFSDLVISEGGAIERVDEWGKRRLAYPIEDRMEGYYVLMTFKSDAEFPIELERNFKITDNIMRYMVIRLDENDEAAEKEAVQHDDAETADVVATGVAEEAAASEAASADTQAGENKES
jgi:small subunit ribosomal protein S6